MEFNYVVATVERSFYSQYFILWPSNGGLKECKLLLLFWRPSNINCLTLTKIKRNETLFTL